jgi:hypothetical protein
MVPKKKKPKKSYTVKYNTQIGIYDLTTALLNQSLTAVQYSAFTYIMCEWSIMLKAKFFKNCDME